MKTMLRALGLCLFIATALALDGCGDGSDGHPDTGYGADQPAPATVNCVDFCQRAADCAADLCDEDKNSTEYEELEPALDSDCVSTCTDAQIQSGISATAWQCLFEDSCRQVFGDDSCHVMGTYTCSN